MHNGSSGGENLNFETYHADHLNEKETTNMLYLYLYSTSETAFSEALAVSKHIQKDKS